jgi:stringent starvation protein B
MDSRSAEKQLRLEHALELGPVMIHLDARRPGVMVPDRFREDFHLRLNLSLRFEPPDLTVGEWGVRETLSFGGSRYTVAIPWSAIFAITGIERTDSAFLFPEDMPAELLEAAARQFGLTGDEMELLRSEHDLDRKDLVSASDPQAQHPPAGLRVVCEEPATGAQDEQPPDGTEPPQKKRFHLKLVK